MTISIIIRLNLNLNNLCSPHVDLIGCVLIYIVLKVVLCNPTNRVRLYQIVKNNLENVLDCFDNRVVNLIDRRGDLIGPVSIELIDNTIYSVVTVVIISKTTEKW